MDAALHWGLQLEAPFGRSACSYVAPARDVVVKVSWGGDDESLHEADALRLWNGRGAVRLIDCFGTAILEERATPGSDLSAAPEKEGLETAVGVAQQLWCSARQPFRPVVPEVRRWLDHAEGRGSELVPRARVLLDQVGRSEGWVVHGDFHHHNIVLHNRRYLAIDPKPYLSDREYDVPSFLWNPSDDALKDRQQVESRISAFVAAGLDEFRIRAWTVIRGAYLRPALAGPLAAVMSG